MPAVLRRKSSAAREWDAGSLVDLEFFAGDGHDADATAKARDRGFFLGLQQSDPGMAGDRVRVMRRWVEMMAAAAGGATPGQAVAEVLRALRWWGCAVLFAIGFFFAWGALNITGRQVNVALFWMLVVALPLCVTLLAFLPVVWPRRRRSAGVIGGWLAGRLAAAAASAVAKADRTAPQDARTRAMRLRGELRRRLSGRGALLGGAVASLLHGYGLAAALGIVASIGLFRTVSDQDYGWSTHSGWLTDERMHAVVTATALPWRWLAGEGVGHPTLEQVRGTRVFRGQGGGRAPDGASAAWSAFLLWNAVFYGVLPRLLLVVAGRCRFRQSLAGFDFDRYDAVWRRMASPAFGIEAPADTPAPAGNPGSVQTHATPGAGVLWVPESLDSPALRESIARALRRHDFEVVDVESLPDLPSHRRRFVGECGGRGISRLMVAQSASMVPNESFLRLLRELRGAVGERVPVHVVLVPVDATADAVHRVAAWRERVAAHGDPWLGLVALDAGEHDQEAPEPEPGHE